VQGYDALNSVKTDSTTGVWLLKQPPGALCSLHASFKVSVRAHQTFGPPLSFVTGVQCQKSQLTLCTDWQIYTFCTKEVQKWAFSRKSSSLLPDTQQTSDLLLRFMICLWRRPRWCFQWPCGKCQSRLEMDFLEWDSILTGFCVLITILFVAETSFDRPAEFEHEHGDGLDPSQLG